MDDDFTAAAPLLGFFDNECLLPVHVYELCAGWIFQQRSDIQREDPLRAFARP
jgi:hypothetical protein